MPGTSSHRDVVVNIQRRKSFAAAVEADAMLKEKSASAKALAATILERYDTNRDGEFNLGEVVDIIEDLQSEQRGKRRYRKMFLLAVVGMLVLLGLNACLTAAVV